MIHRNLKHSVFTVLFPDKNIEEVFGLLNELNYDGVELRVKEDYHVSPHQILSQVKDLENLKTQYGLEIPVLGAYTSIDDRKVLMPMFEAAAILGAKGIRLSLGSPLNGPTPYWNLLGKTQRQLEGIVQSIQAFGVKALFEIHFKTLISSPSLAYLLLRKFDPALVGVIFDPANMIIEGREDWKLSVEILGDYLAHIHVKNASWHREDKWNWQWDDLESGMVNWEDIMEVLSTTNYQGYLSNENLSSVVLPGATGFIGEQLSDNIKKPSKPIHIKLAEDLRYLKGLEEKFMVVHPK